MPKAEISVEAKKSLAETEKEDLENKLFIEGFEKLYSWDLEGHTYVQGCEHAQQIPETANEWVRILQRNRTTNMCTERLILMSWLMLLCGLANLKSVGHTSRLQI